METFKILTGRDNLKPEHFFEATKVPREGMDVSFTEK